MTKIIIDQKAVMKEVSDNAYTLIKEEKKKIEKILGYEIVFFEAPILNYMEVKESIKVLVYSKRKNNTFDDYRYGYTIMNFTIVQMPGFCGIGILTHLENKVEREKGIGTLLHKIAIKVIKDLNYSTAKLTILKPKEGMPSYRERYVNIVKKDGFILDREIYNLRTKNTVLEFTKSLIKE